MNLHTLCNAKVRWSRNGLPRSSRAGFDSADTLHEAFAIAEARVRGGGLPAKATVYIGDEDNTPVRTYFLDFDARVTYSEHEQVAA